MSRVCKHKPPSVEEVQKPYTGDIVRSDHSRSYIINPTSSSSGSDFPAFHPAYASRVSTQGVAPLASYDTDTTASSSSFSSILSAATSAEFPPPPTPWMLSLEEARNNQGLHVSSASSELQQQLEWKQQQQQQGRARQQQQQDGRTQQQQQGRSLQQSEEPFYENTSHGYQSGPSSMTGSACESLYENQQIINNHSRSSLANQQVVYENSRDNSGYEAANHRVAKNSSGYEAANRRAAKNSSGYEAANHRAAKNRYSNAYTPLSGRSSEADDSGEPRGAPCDGSTLESTGYEDPWELEAAQIDLISDASDWFIESTSGNSQSGSQRSSGQNSRSSDQSLSSEKSSSQNAGRSHGRVDQRGEGSQEVLRLDEQVNVSRDHCPQLKDDHNKNTSHEPLRKDERPQGEYDRPWDERVQIVESNLAAAKIAKDAIKVSRNRAERLQAPVTTPAVDPAVAADMRGNEGYDKPWDLKPHQKDERPSGEYEQAWDRKYQDAEGDVIAAKLAKEASRLADGIEKRRGLKEVKTEATGSNPGPVDKTEQKVSDKPVSDKLVSDKPVSNKLVESRDCKKTGRPPVAQPRTSHGGNVSKQQQHVQDNKPCAAGSSLERHRWYHGALGRSQAEAVMREKGEGSFLVRCSDVDNSSYSLSIRSQTGFIHLKIVVDGEGRYVLGQFSQPFNSVSQMIQYYSINKLPIMGTERISLTSPVPNDRV